MVTTNIKLLLPLYILPLDVELKNNTFFALVTHQTDILMGAAQKRSNYKCVVGPRGWRDELPHDPQISLRTEDDMDFVLH